MELQHIEIENLKTTNVNVRKKGGKDIADLVPSIRSLGIIQPLLVRPNCEGFEIVAGQRRYHALLKLADEAKDEGKSIEPVPCIVMKDGDDAKAIEASLAENVARLPMDEIDQYKAFSALVKKGQSAEEIAYHFGISERLVRQRLAIANLYQPILTAYSKDEISAGTIRSLTLATTKQQKAWWALFKSDDYAPQGHALKEWLFGGSQISVDHALFDPTRYDGSIISDLFGDEAYFDDAAKFWALQNEAIAEAKASFEGEGWPDVVVLGIGERWYEWEHVETTKEEGGRVYIQISSNGEVAYRAGYLTEKEAKRREKMEQGEIEAESASPKAEITKTMQNYLSLHRHSAVRTELLGAGGIALRLAVAQIIAGSNLWTVHADPQKAGTDAISESLTANEAEAVFADERQRVFSLLGIDGSGDETLVKRKNDWDKSHDVHMVFAKLLELDDASVNTILTVVVAETLPCGSALVEILGKVLSVDMADRWQPDETFLDLLRDKEAINAILKQVGGKSVADSHISSTAKVQKKIISDFLDGTRKDGKANWQPRYMGFPFGAYTKRGGIEAIDQWNAVKKHFKDAA